MGGNKDDCSRQRAVEDDEDLCLKVLRAMKHKEDSSHLGNR